MDFVSAVRPSPNSTWTIVLMHGLGSDEQDMLGFADMLDSRFEVICLRAPISYGPGYAWFDIQWTLRGIEIDEEQYWESVAKVSNYLADLGKERLLVGGFSQGAMMALGVVTKRPEIAQGAILLSGRGLDDACPNFEGPIFHAHGAYDDVIPVRESRKLHQGLSALGERYEYHEYEMGHWISEEEVRDLNVWLSKLEA